MRRAARIALLIGGGAFLAMALATPGAQAERSLSRDAGLRDTATASQEPRPQEHPDRIAFVQGSGILSIATAIARLPAAPEVANLKRSNEAAMTELAALETVAEKAKNRAAWSGVLDLDAVQMMPEKTVDDRQPELARAGSGAARELEASQDRTRREPAPVVVEFGNIVINFNLAGSGS